jgi:nickel transport protein
MLLTLLAALLPFTAQAHRLSVFARADGAVIEGMVYYQGMAPARAAHVTVFDPEGVLLIETVTDDQGRFTFQAARRVDHRIVADLKDGHRAEFSVPGAQLPTSLPPASLQRPSPAGSPSTGANGGVEATTVAEAMAEPAAIEAMVDAAVARHVGPLREQIAAYEDKIRWHDVLGGIGYIVGMGGLACYVLARRRGS